MIKIYSKGDTISNNDNPNTSYLQMLLDNNTTKYITNCNTKIKIMEINNKLFPFSINEKNYHDTYISSVYTHYILYAKDEVELLNSKTERFAYRQILNILSVILKFGSINNNIMFNNLLVSTCLYQTLDINEIQQITEFLNDVYPYKTVMFRGFNEKLSPNLKENLLENNYKIIPYRQVYIQNKELSKNQKNDIKKDLKALKNNNFTLKYPNKSEVKQITKLYSQLYIGKYSQHNPQITEKFIFDTMENKFLTYIGIYTNKNELVAVSGFYNINGTITSPIFGYDMTYDTGKRSLYFMLTSVLINYSISHELILNSSSGASICKQNRGASEFIEYAAFKAQSKKSKIAINILKYLVDSIATKVIKKNNF